MPLRLATSSGRDDSSPDTRTSGDLFIGMKLRFGSLRRSRPIRRSFSYLLIFPPEHPIAGSELVQPESIDNAAIDDRNVLLVIERVGHRRRVEILSKRIAP